MGERADRPAWICFVTNCVTKLGGRICDHLSSRDMYKLYKGGWGEGRRIVLSSDSSQGVLGGVTVTEGWEEKTRVGQFCLQKWTTVRWDWIGLLGSSKHRPGSR
jgi:hypothetical protein